MENWGRWFQTWLICFFSISYMGYHPSTNSYFSEGLKPWNHQPENDLQMVGFRGFPIFIVTENHLEQHVVPKFGSPTLRTSRDPHEHPEQNQLEHPICRLMVLSVRLWGFSDVFKHSFQCAQKKKVFSKGCSKSLSVAMYIYIYT